jgi:hypothetical protein
MSGIKNQASELFYLNIYGNNCDEVGAPIPWWYRAKITITSANEEITTELELLTTEDLHLLEQWLRQIYAGEPTTPIFQFVDGHVWFSLCKKCNTPILRFFIQVDEMTEYHWDWDYQKDNDKLFLDYIAKEINGLKG